MLEQDKVERHGSAGLTGGTTSALGRALVSSLTSQRGVGFKVQRDAREYRVRSTR